MCVPAHKKSGTFERRPITAGRGVGGTIGLIISAASSKCSTVLPLRCNVGPALRGSSPVGATRTVYIGRRKYERTAHIQGPNAQSRSGGHSVVIVRHVNGPPGPQRRTVHHLRQQSAMGDRFPQEADRVS